MSQFDIPEALELLGIEYDVRGSEANSYCPMHEARTGKIDHSPSWWVNLETGQHICFSCGYKGGLLSLVCDIKGFHINTWGQTEPDYQAAKFWLSTVAEISIEKLGDMLAKLPAYISPSPKPLEMSEARLAVYIDPPQEELDKRHLTLEAAKQYGIMWDDKKKAWILPLRDPHFNKLLGWQEKGTVDRTFFNRPAGLTKSKTLFGVENQNEESVIVVESPLDCARIASAGIKGAVAICGSSLSEDQVRLLRFSRRVIIAFDNPNVDNAGKKASKEAVIWARKYGLNLFFFNYGSSSKKDPGDMTDEELLWGIENAKSSILGESAYVQGNAQTVSG